MRESNILLEDICNVIISDITNILESFCRDLKELKWKSTEKFPETDSLIEDYQKLKQYAEAATEGAL